MMADKIQAWFPEGVLMPEPIRVLCDYFDEFGYPVSGGSFRFGLSGDEREGIFTNDEEMQKQIAVFALSSTGGFYVLWLTQASEPNNAPVAIIGTEGDFLVLAETPLDFCQLLGCGYEELEWDDLSQPPKNWEETEPLRKWFKDKLNIDCPTSGAEIRDRAEACYPGFAKWVNDWLDANVDS